MNKLEHKKKQKKDALLNTAFDLFISKGIQKTSISDIVEKAGVAKGTFYLYFKDKYDLRNKLISHKANQLLNHAYDAMCAKMIQEFEEQIIYMADYIIREFKKDKSLLSLISKHLSWGIFKSFLSRTDPEYEQNAFAIYEKIMAQSGYAFHEPEIMLYMIVELISASIYSPILYGQPVTVEEIKPYIFAQIRSIIKNHIEPGMQ